MSRKDPIDFVQRAEITKRHKSIQDQRDDLGMKKVYNIYIWNKG